MLSTYYSIRFFINWIIDDTNTEIIKQTNNIALKIFHTNTHFKNIKNNM